MFHFTIRDILWLMAVVAICLLWQAERPSSHRSQDFKQKEAKVAKR